MRPFLLTFAHIVTSHLSCISYLTNQHRQVLKRNPSRLHRYPSSLLMTGSTHASLVLKHAMGRRSMDGFICLQPGSVVGQQCFLSTVPVTCKMFIAGGVRIIASTCFITC